MDEIIKHRGSPLNNVLLITIDDTSGRDEYIIGCDGVPAKLWNRVVFHEGNVADVGVTGISIESLLAIADHRLAVLNAKFPSRENSIAATHLQTALMWLQERTRDRTLRGVEGTKAV